MKKFLAVAVVCFSLVCFSVQTASAQLPGGIPRIPKPKPKATPAPAESAQPAPPTSETPATPTQPRPSTPAATTPAAAASDDLPPIQKDTIQMNAWTKNQYKGDWDVWSWVPRIQFRVNGPIASGSQLYVEFMQPGGNVPWLKFDCETGEIQKGYWWKTECGGRDVEEKSILTIGVVNFAIKMRNELMGTDATLFNGRFKVAKALTNEVGPKAAKKFVYYVDHDWNLPIGYIFYTPDSVYGWDYPTFNIAFWVRGDKTNFDPHLFYQGKEIGRLFMDGMQVGRGSCGATVENRPTHTPNDTWPQKATWSFVECSFPVVKRWDKTNEGRGQPNTNEMFKMASNPGEYEFKVLWNNKLARSIKFTVGPDGNIDNGIATSNKVGTKRVIVPVQIIGDQDGVWDKAAWKTDAFYGHPLTGFNPPQ